MADKELIRFYFDTMSLNEHLMQWYRAVFVTFYAGVIIVAFALGTEKLVELAFPLVLCGLIVSFLWVWLTSQRARIVERQKNKIKELTKGDKGLVDCFKIYESKWVKRLPEITFNILFPLFIGGSLIYALWKFALPSYNKSSLLYKFLLTWPLEFQDACSAFCVLLALVFIILLIVAIKKLSWIGVARD